MHPCPPDQRKLHNDNSPNYIAVILAIYPQVYQNMYVVSCPTSPHAMSQVGELSSAVGELEKLEGLPKETVRDWLKDARTRLTADEALKVIRCHASLLSAKHLGKA